MLSDQLPLESSSVDFVVGSSKSYEFPAATLLAEIFRVTKPDGRILFELTQDDGNMPSEKVFLCEVVGFSACGISPVETLLQLNLHPKNKKKNERKRKGEGVLLTIRLT